MYSSKTMVATRLISEFEQDPVVPEQAPRACPATGTSPVSSEARLNGTRTNQPVELHHEIGATHRLGVLAGETGDGEREEASDRAEPADRGR